MLQRQFCKAEHKKEAAAMKHIDYQLSMADSHAAALINGEGSNNVPHGFMNNQVINSCRATTVVLPAITLKTLSDRRHTFSCHDSAFDQRMELGSDTCPYHELLRTFNQI